MHEARANGTTHATHLENALQIFVYTDRRRLQRMEDGEVAAIRQLQGGAVIRKATVYTRRYFLQRSLNRSAFKTSDSWSSLRRGLGGQLGGVQAHTWAYAQ